jgi:hypothetical protein
LEIADENPRIRCRIIDLWRMSGSLHHTVGFSARAVCDAAQILKKILGKFSRNRSAAYAKFRQPFEYNQIWEGRFTINRDFRPQAAFDAGGCYSAVPAESLWERRLAAIDSTIVVVASTRCPERGT